MKYLDKIDESCSLIGAVNTVVNNDGVLKGYNTDMDGFLDPLKKRNLKLQILKCSFRSRRSCKSNCCRICKRKSKEHHNCKQNIRKCKKIIRVCKKNGLDANAIKIRRCRKILQKITTLL